MTAHPVPDYAVREIAEVLRDAGLDAEAFPDGRTVGFGDVDTPHGYAYRLHVSGGTGGYVVEVTDPSGDEVLAALATGTRGDVVALCVEIAAE